MKSFHEHWNYLSGISACAYELHDMNVTPHWHNDIEFIYVCNGSVNVGINQNHHILGRNSLAIVGSGDIHYMNACEKASSAIIMVFSPQSLDFYMRWPKEARFDPPFIDNIFLNSIDPTGCTSLRIQELIYSVLKEHVEQKDSCDLFIKSKLLELCAIAQRYFPNAPLNSVKENKNHTNIKIMHEILQYVADNYKEEISLENTAEYFHLSPFYFSRLFKKMCGINFKEYVIRIKIKKAESLILNTEDNISDIALKCGFESIRTFNRAFRSINGYTPSSLR